jgi:heptosyltransferase I
VARHRGNRILRALDKWIGIPVVVITGLVRRRHPRPLRPQRIGLMKTVAIGDTVMASAIWCDVRAAYPAAQMVLITGEDNRAVGEMFAGDAERLVVSPHHPIRSALAVRRAKLDILVDFGPWARFDAELAGLSGACTVGFRTRGQYRHGVYDLPVEHRWDVHEIENFRALAAAIGVESRSVPDIRIAAPVTRSDLPEPYVVFHPWAGGFRNEIKEWPAARWAELGRVLAAKGFHIVLSGGPADGEASRQLASRLRDEPVDAIDVASRFSLRDLGHVVAWSAGGVSVNPGIAHFAAGVGARTLSLVGPTAARRWKPLGRHTAAVESSLKGCGYLHLGWEYEGNRLDCMTGIDVASVVDALDKLMSG